MSRRYERLASAIVGTPLQALAEAAREAKNALVVKREPGLRNVLAETKLTYRLMRRYLRPDTNCVDVGCHLGAMLHQMVTLAPDGRHHAFEPVPYKAAWLERKFPSVIVHQVALSDREGNERFFVDESSSGLSALRSAGEGASAGAINVDTRRLDEVLPEDLAVGFIKIDAIGGELSVIKGADRTVRNHRPIVLFESSQATLTNFELTAADVYDHVVKDLGYELYSLRGITIGDSPLDLERLEAAMVFPFEAFNFVALPPPT